MENCMEDQIAEVVEMGANAAREGKTDKDNPYGLEDSVRFGAWLAGFISGNANGRAERP